MTVFSCSYYKCSCICQLSVVIDLLLRWFLHSVFYKGLLEFSFSLFFPYIGKYRRMEDSVTDVDSMKKERERERDRTQLRRQRLCSKPDCPGVSRSDHSSGSKESAWWRAEKMNKIKAIFSSTLGFRHVSIYQPLLKSTPTWLVERKTTMAKLEWKKTA